MFPFVCLYGRLLGRGCRSPVFRAGRFPVVPQTGGAFYALFAAVPGCRHSLLSHPALGFRVVRRLRHSFPGGGRLSGGMPACRPVCGLRPVSKPFAPGLFLLAPLRCFTVETFLAIFATCGCSGLLRRSRPFPVSFCPAARYSPGPADDSVSVVQRWHTIFPKTKCV